MKPLLEKKLLIVTGKGGVGKTAISSALALLASSQGKRTLLVEALPRGDLSAAFDCGPTPYEGLKFKPNLSLMTMDNQAALREYLKIFFHIPFAGRIGPLARALDFVATAAPGVKEIITMGKITYEVKEAHHDLVVVDAPPTGHVVGHLRAPEAINELVRTGPVKSQTGWMKAILEDPDTTNVLIVTTPGELPVSETLELAEAIGKNTSVELGAVVMNQMLPAHVLKSDYELLKSQEGEPVLAQAASVLGCNIKEVAEAAFLGIELSRQAAEHARYLRARLTQSIPVINVPFVFDQQGGLKLTAALASQLEQELL